MCIITIVAILFSVTRGTEITRLIFEYETEFQHSSAYTANMYQALLSNSYHSHMTIKEQAQR